MNFFKLSALSLISGYFIDLLIGDPPKIPHPICFIGSLIGKTEKFLRKYFKADSRSLNIAGVLLVVITLSISAAVPTVIILIGYKINTLAVYIIQSIMCWQILATKSLKTESMKVYAALNDQNIEKARFAVSMIVGRDTQSLDEVGVAKAAIETVAENTCDGVIAPIIYCLLGGPVGGFIYKAINTMDSMVGYKNEKYLNFGMAAAVLDDWANYIPARLSAFLMIAACPLCGFNMTNSVKIWKRDRRKHASPNSAQTESVCAGALEIRLAGDAIYGGKVKKKDFIGDDIKPVDCDDIKRANKLMIGSSLLLISTIAVILALSIGGGRICL
ncbi:MAG: adenosylcobinamide-phosphate synthase CbiB [Oscillospiraceae bacterium]